MGRVYFTCFASLILLVCDFFVYLGKPTEDDDDDLVVIEDLEIEDKAQPEEQIQESRKRPAEDPESPAVTKRRAAASGDSEDIIEIS